MGLTEEDYDRWWFLVVLCRQYSSVTVKGLMVFAGRERLSSSILDEVLVGLLLLICDELLVNEGHVFIPFDDVARPHVVLLLATSQRKVRWLRQLCWLSIESIISNGT